MQSVIVNAKIGMQVGAQTVVWLQAMLLYSPLGVATCTALSVFYNLKFSTKFLRL